MRAKLWITGITSKGNEQHLEELIEPIKHLFDGICWVFHTDDEVAEVDTGYQYLNKIIGEYKRDGKAGGVIIKSPWVRRTDFSRNKTLFEGPMKQGDWFLIIDTLERIDPQMIIDIKGLIEIYPQVTGFYLENKRLFFKMAETLEFRGNPHEGLHGAGPSINLTKENYPNIDKLFSNVRPQYRDSYHWVGAYLNYYFFPNTNHLILGYENNNDYIKERYFIRARFLKTLFKEGVDFNIPSLKEYIKEHGIEKIKTFLNQEKILNDWYRFEFLGDTTIIDKHDPSLIREIQ